MGKGWTTRRYTEEFKSSMRRRRADLRDTLVAAGIRERHRYLERHRYSERPAQYEYLLTEKGRDLAPALIALTAWGDRWASPGGPPISYRHAACGGPISHEILCAHCGAVEAAHVVVQPGPDMPAEYLANHRPQRAASRIHHANEPPTARRPEPRSTA